VSATTDRPTSLDLLDRAFQELVTGSQAPALDGSRYAGGLPQRQLGFDELQAVLLRPSTSYATRDAVWRELIDRARRGDERWVIGAAGILMPGLRRVAHRLAVREVDAAEVDAQVVLGFLEALISVTSDRGHIASRLCWETFREAERACRGDRHAREWCVPWSELAVAPRHARGHPDLVLERAVRAGVVTEAEADVVGTTRLEGVSIRDLATRTRTGPASLRQRRLRAECRLVSWLHPSGRATSVRLPQRSRRQPIRLVLHPPGTPTRPARRVTGTGMTTGPRLPLRRPAGPEVGALPGGRR
jgi:hypothetical protein